MKSKIILCLALVLSGILSGCSSTSLTAGTKVFDYSNSDSTASGSGKIEGFGKGFSIRAAADSWSTLIKIVKPTFAWNGCDMMWIESDRNDRPQFTLDEAYISQPTNQPLQWILVNDERARGNFKQWQGEEWWHQFSCSNLRAVATLHDAVPLPNNDAGERGNYAVVIAANQKFGTVYEIGWQREMCEGTAHADYARRIYVFKDTANNWHFLGEGPEEGWARDGGNTTQSRVVWDASKTNEFPFQVRFITENTTQDYASDADDMPYLTICREYILSGKFPVQFYGSGERPYLLAEKNDTFEKIVQRLGFFWPDWKYYPDKVRQETLKRQILQMWRTSLVHLNPLLPITGNINERSRVELLTDQEFQKLNPAKE
jgi:hypothetical protein